MAPEDATKVPQFKWPYGQHTSYCRCAVYEAPENRPSEKCPCHGWQLTGREVPKSDSIISEGEH